MEEEKKLYPLKFVSLRDDYVWGSEEFKLADLGYRDSFILEGWLASNTVSELMDTYMDRVVGDKVYESYGRQFPLCVRCLKTSGRMPLRVSPEDELARERYDLLGKEKLWYVVSAGSDARIMMGFKKDTDASELYSKCLDGTVEDILNVVSVHKGQVFRIAPGTPHAACGEVTIAEISQSSPLDFCLCTWGNEIGEDEFDSALGLVDALDFIDYKAFRYVGPKGDVLVDLPQMRVERHNLSSKSLKVGAGDGFVLYVCLQGEASVLLDVQGQEASFRVSALEAVLVPSECEDFRVVPSGEDCIVLEATVPATEPKDSYTGE